MSESRFELVIFDCDGVLVDSERLTNTVFADMLNEQGLSLTLSDMFDQFVGRTTMECMATAKQMLGKAPPPDFLDRYRSRCRELLSTNLKPVSGVREVLQQLAIPTCVASSGEMEKIQLTLGITGLLPMFEGRIFSVVDEGTRPKPHPDIFLRAANRMGVDPHKCAVIEDTPTGVGGGVAAGMTVFGYAELMPAARLQEKGAAVTFTSMDELPELLGCR